MTEAGECLVQQHQTGMRHQRPRQFHQAQFPRRQPSGDLFGLIDESDPVERRQGHVAGDSIGRGADKGADDDIFEDAHARKRAHDLKGAPDAAPAHLVWAQPGDRLAGEGDRTAIRGEKPVDDIEQRRLAGAVRADYAVEPALGKGEVDPVQRAQPAERDPDIAQHQKIGAG